MLYYREDLDGGTGMCESCRRDLETTGACFRPLCHANSPMVARYRAGVLAVECCRCQKEVLSVVVASWNDELHIRRRRRPELEDEERCP